MSTNIRPELSKKNPYWLPKHRYYELKHFTMQYPAWIAARNGLDFLGTPSFEIRVKKDPSDPTMTCAELREYYTNRIDMVNRADLGCGCPIYVLYGILNEASYEKILALHPDLLMYTKDKYYECYRRFFWILNHERQ